LVSFSRLFRGKVQMSRERIFDADYVAERQAAVIERIAEDDANFGRLVLFGILELAKQSLRATGPRNRVDLTIRATVTPVGPPDIGDLQAKEKEKEEETTKCTEVELDLVVFKITRTVHKTSKTKDAKA
jgi:hypothetical protein